jgi:multidrug efflux pump subunit AcrB
METRITSIYERALTTTVGDVDHIESQSLNGVAVIKVYLQPQANVDGAIAEVDAEASDDEAAPSGNHAAAGHPV